MAAIGSAARAGDASAASRDPSGRTDTVLTRFGSGKPLFVVETLVAGGGGTGTEAAPCVVIETDPSFGPPSVITRICLTCWSRSTGCSSRLTTLATCETAARSSTEALWFGTLTPPGLSGATLTGPLGALTSASSCEAGLLRMAKLAPMPTRPAQTIAPMA